MLTLNALTAALQQFGPQLVGDGTVTLLDVTQDSRAVRAGSLFVARSGETTQGWKHVPDALRRGAVAVMGERPPVEQSVLGEAPLLRVESLPKALALAAELVHGLPSAELSLVGITGTNGKTTTACLVTQCLRALSLRAGQLGTLGLDLQGQNHALGFTTPQADETSRCLRQAVDQGVDYFTMEVSSHALVQERVSALKFSVAAFSNLSQDHLDYHRTMKAYAEAKALLMTACQPRYCVLNIDDAFGRELAQRVHQPITVGRSADALVRLVEEKASPKKTELKVTLPGTQLRFQTRMVGAHNTDNWLLTLGILYALEVELGGLEAVSAGLPGAPGRLERCEEDEDELSVIVDYAHTPDALKRALQAVAPLTTGKLWCVFGCGGDRDAAKRPLMGREAGRLAHRVVVTTDNPRSEPPARIIEHILKGVEPSVARDVIEDRAEAIAFAVANASCGDLILIAGKGHEDYQILGDRRIDFDDRQHARSALLRRREQG